MDHAAAMRQGECAPDLSQQARYGVELPWTCTQRRLEVASLEPAHHQIGTVWLPPIVVQRHDVGVLQASHELRLSVEAPDELGIVGEFRSRHLDRYLTAHSGLFGAVDDSKTAFPDVLDQLVSTEVSADITRFRFQLRDEIRMSQLEHPVRQAQILEPELPDVDQFGSGWDVSANELLSGQRNEDLITVGGRQDPGATVQRRSKVVAVPFLGTAGVDRHPDLEAAGCAPVCSLQRKLARDCRIDGVSKHRVV